MRNAHTVYEMNCIRAELGADGRMVIITEGTTLPKDQQQVVGITTTDLFAIARAVRRSAQTDDRMDARQQQLPNNDTQPPQRNTDGDAAWD